MRTALKLLVPLFAAALVIAALTQPASAYYPPDGKKRVQATRPVETKLKQLAAENERLRKELEAAKERTRRASRELDELREKLGHLRNAVVLRNKLHAKTQSRREQPRPVQKPPEKPEVRKDEVVPVSHTSTESERAPLASMGRSGVLERFLGIERVKRVRRLIEEMVQRHYPPRPQSFTPQPKSEGAPVEAKKTPSPKGGQGLELLRDRIKALKSRLKSTIKSTPAPKKVKSPRKGLKRPSAPRVPKKLKDELLEELREGFRKELGRKLKELKREVGRNRTPAKPRPSAWF